MKKSFVANDFFEDLKELGSSMFISPTEPVPDGVSSLERVFVKKAAIHRFPIC